MELENTIIRTCINCDNSGVEFIYHLLSVEPQLCHVCEGMGYYKVKVRKIDYEE